MSIPVARSADVVVQLSNELYSRHSLCMSEQWLTKFLSTMKTPLPPLPVLVSTAHFRVLNSDIRQCLINSSSSLASANQRADRRPLLLPADITNVNTKSMILPTNVPVQVLTIADIGMSKGAQIEAIERHERGEEVRGREVIRNVPIMAELYQSSTSDNNNNTTATSTTTGQTSSTPNVKRSHGPHKILLQDADGLQVYGVEIVPVPKIFITNTIEEGGICIGCKLLLKRGCLVRRGMVMLKAEDVVVLGGKIDAWDVAWRSGRKERLTQEIKNEHNNNNNSEQIDGIDD